MDQVPYPVVLTKSKQHNSRFEATNKDLKLIKAAASRCRKHKSNHLQKTEMQHHGVPAKKGAQNGPAWLSLRPGTAGLGNQYLKSTVLFV